MIKKNLCFFILYVVSLSSHGAIFSCKISKDRFDYLDINTDLGLVNRRVIEFEDGSWITTNSFIVGENVILYEFLRESCHIRNGFLGERKDRYFIEFSCEKEQEWRVGYLEISFKNREGHFSSKGSRFENDRELSCHL